MTQHQIKILGGSHESLRVPASVLRDALSALLTGAERAARFRVEGRSSKRGTKPNWLVTASDVQVTGLTSGSAVIDVAAVPLRESDPERFGPDGQGTLFEDAAEWIADRTAVELFADLLGSIVDGDDDKVLADDALLASCAEFAQIGGGDFGGIEISGIRGSVTPLRIGRELVPRITALRQQTPHPRAARLSGRLETISASKSDFVIALEDDTRVPARLEEHDADRLRELFGTEVVVSGMASFRASGGLLLIDVETIRPAAATDAMFAAVPKVRPATIAGRIRQTATSGVGAIFGTWPGEESDEELLTALTELG